LQLLQDLPVDAQQETLEIRDAGAKAREITIVAHGPVLGSMDSETLSTDLACSDAGLVLSATITRSADYQGALRQNLLWFPQITIVVVPLTQDMVLQANWRMRLTNGTMVESFRTPPYPEKKCPIKVTKRFVAR
jgi:hypothetical protein